MVSPTENISMALFCDFENVALGVRDIQQEKFDIKPVLERLLLKGSIVVKKAYCDWDRYKGFKATMHEANFELIEIPHVRQSGKNSADIRLVVDALDLCYTKSHVNTFVIISGDSDFSPLVSKLRENAKQVIGVGVRQSTSDLLIANCDEFIFYDDLVRESQRSSRRRDPQNAPAPTRRSPDEENHRREDLDKRRRLGVEMAVETFDALQSERGDSGKIWASVLKEAIKRRKPDFSESNYGFRAFGNLLEEASARGLLQFGRDEKSGAYVFRDAGPVPRSTTRHDFTPPDAHDAMDAVPPQPDSQPPVEGDSTGRDGERREPRRRSRGGRGRNPVERQDTDTQPDIHHPRTQDGAPPFAEQGSDSDFQPTTNMFSRPASLPTPHAPGQTLLEETDKLGDNAVALDEAATESASTDAQGDETQSGADSAPVRAAAKRPARPRSPRKSAAPKKSKD